MVAVERVVAVEQHYYYFFFHAVVSHLCMGMVTPLLIPPPLELERKIHCCTVGLGKGSRRLYL